MNFVTVAELNNDIVNGMNILPKDIDIVVGIPRSGMLVATLVALYLNKPLTDIDSFKDGKMYTSGSTKNLSQTVKQYYDEIKKSINS